MREVTENRECEKRQNHARGAKLNGEWIGTVFKQLRDYQHSEAVKQSCAMCRVDVNRSDVLGCCEHSPVLDDAD